MPMKHEVSQFMHSVEPTPLWCLPRIQGYECYAASPQQQSVNLHVVFRKGKDPHSMRLKKMDSITIGSCLSPHQVGTISDVASGHVLGRSGTLVDGKLNWMSPG